MYEKTDFYDTVQRWIQDDFCGGLTELSKQGRPSSDLLKRRIKSKEYEYLG